MKTSLTFLCLILACALPARAQMPGTPTTFFIATSDKIVANTTTATSIMGNGIGSSTVPAGSLFVGRTYRIATYGYFSTATLAPSCTVTVKCGSVTLVSATLSSLVGSLTQQAFNSSFTFTCRSTGTSGSVLGQGSINYALTGNAKRDDLKMTAPATIDTTVDNTFDVTVTWGTASASNSLTRSNMILEALN